MTTTTETGERAATTTWTIDPAHTVAGFGVRHLMISRVKGRFASVQGTIEVDGGDAETAEIDVTIDAASIDTREEKRDTHLRSADFFDVERFPHLRFVSDSVRRTGEDELEVRGKLTIRDVTRDVTLRVEELGTAQDPWGGHRAGYSATTTVDRKDFGLTWNQALEAGGVLVGDEVKIELDVQLVRQ
jgi:polyisoprenoid-binding protein YceI